MTDLTEWLEQEPHEGLVFLPDRSSSQTIADQIVALANQQGGVILIGLTRGGLVSGLDDPDTMEQQALSALLQTDPPLTGGLVRVEAEEFEGLPLLKIVVPDGLPTIYRARERYLQRVGTETQIMSTSSLRALILARREQPFDQRVPAGASATDLSRSAIEQFLQHLPDYDDSSVGAQQRVSHRRSPSAPSARGLSPRTAGCAARRQGGRAAE